MRTDNSGGDLQQIYSTRFAGRTEYRTKVWRVLAGYFGHARGGGVTQAIYPGDRGAQLGYAEAVVRF